MQEYVCWERMPEAKSDEDAAFDAKWAKIIAVRDDVKKVLEQARAIRPSVPLWKLPLPCTAAMKCMTS